MARSRYGRCPLCGRHCALTLHHLIPKKLHRRNRFKRDYSRDTLNRGILICRQCHDGIHTLYDEMTLARELASLDALQADPALARHCRWMARQRVRAAAGEAPHR